MAACIAELISMCAADNSSPTHVGVACLPVRYCEALYIHIHLAFSRSLSGLFLSWLYVRHRVGYRDRLASIYADLSLYTGHQCVG